MVAERLSKETIGSSQKQAVAEIKSRIRWEAPSNGSKIRIMRCGKKVPGVSNVLMEISATGSNRDLFPSWQAALQQRAERMAATGSNRVSHDGIATGSIPVAERE